MCPFPPKPFPGVCFRHSVPPFVFLTLACLRRGAARPGTQGYNGIAALPFFDAIDPSEVSTVQAIARSCSGEISWLDIEKLVFFIAVSRSDTVEYARVCALLTVNYHPC